MLIDRAVDVYLSNLPLVLHLTSMKLLPPAYALYTQGLLVYGISAQTSKLCLHGWLYESCCWFRNILNSKNDALPAFPLTKACWPYFMCHQQRGDLGMDLKRSGEVYHGGAARCIAIVPAAH